MNDNTYISDRAGGSGIAGKVFAVLCIVMVIALVAVYFYIEGFSNNDNSVVPQFDRALTDGDYNKALEIYRQVQDTVLSAPPDQAAKFENENAQLFRLA